MCASRASFAKILAAAIAEGRPPKEIADEYTDIFMRDERALGIIPADVFPRATEHIPEMIDMIVKLIDKFKEKNKNVISSFQNENLHLNEIYWVHGCIMGIMGASEVL